MKIQDIIVKKKNKKALTKEEIEFFVENVVSGNIKDYETTALLMAIAINNMNIDETYNLTMAMANSGSIVNYEQVKGVVVDKHSTGGVSDSTTLIVAPILASLGVKMGKMSGRGLGFTGGTADKLEVFTGYNVNQTEKDFINIINTVGASIISQTESLVPADKVLYNLRNLTGSVESIPLIAASIMSKKLASNANVIVLDVKFGNGAFMKTIAKATQLAKVMVAIGKRAGKKTVAIITNMNSPLGSGIGSNLEVKNAINVLLGKNNDLAKVSKTIAEKLIVLSGSYNSKNAKKAINDAITSGNALLKLQEIIRAHGGDDQIITRHELMKKPKTTKLVKATKAGYINVIKAKDFGQAVKELGGGRVTKNSKINHTVGIKLFVKLNSKVKKGDNLFEIHASSDNAAKQAEEMLEKAIIIRNNKVSKGKLIQSIIR